MNNYSPNQALRIFVSHSSKDNYFGLKLIQDLRSELSDESAVWYDAADGLLGGDSWWSKIIQELSTRDTFIIILSPDAMDSVWVLRELDMATIDHKRIVPILYRETALRLDLRSLQYISFVDPMQYELAFIKLLKALELPSVGVKRPPTAAGSNATIFQKQGVIFFKENKMEEADKALRTALSLVNDLEQYLAVMQDYAAVFNARKEWAKLLNLAEEALRLAPPNHSSWENVRRVALKNLTQPHQMVPQQREQQDMQAMDSPSLSLSKGASKQGREGQYFGSYHLVEWLGQRMLGSQILSELYRGVHIYDGTTALIKVWNITLQAGDKRLFLIEADTISKLVHPHIVHLIDYGIDNNTSLPFLVMNPLPRGSLRERHPAGSKLPIATIQTYVRQIAGALQYAHDQNIIHGNLMPENILAGPQQELLLSDFRFASVAKQMKLPNDAIYVAPEQQAGQQSFASDQYALAVMVYEWVIGRLPSSKEILFMDEYMQEHTIFGTPFHGTIPLALENSLIKALSRSPEQRFKRIDDFANAIASVY